MLTQRLSRLEAWLRRRTAARQAQRAKAVEQVAALRALLVQLQQEDPYPGVQAEAYLRAFWPWLLASAPGWPAWALEYALAVGDLPASAGHLARRGPAPAPREFSTARDLVGLLQEQVEAVRADGSAPPLERARVLCRLTGEARRTIKTAELEARVESLEAVLRARQEKERELR